MDYSPPRMWNRLIFVAPVALIAGMIVLALWWNTNQQPSTQLVEDEMSLADGFDTIAVAPALAPTVEPMIVVYVTGALLNQGVYSLPTSARVSDLVEVAGGLIAGADAEHINMAQRLADEQHVHIPTIGAVIAEPSTSASDTIDLNSATITELDKLDGIGPVLAQQIIDYRTEHGPYRAVDDLREVKGIGDSLFEKIVPFVGIGSG